MVRSLWTIRALTPDHVELWIRDPAGNAGFPGTVETIALALQDGWATIPYNPNHAEGMSNSLIAELSAVRDHALGVMIVFADMPAVTTSHMRELVRSFIKAGGGKIVRGAVGQRPGNPVILPKLRAL
jgi:CTP:molybdopterin cytidylyltransferase MocA